MQEIQVSGVELCDYLTWAYYNAVPLDGDDARQAEYVSLATQTCPQEYYDKVAQASVKVSEDNNNIVSSNYLTNLRDSYINYVGKKASNAADLPLAFSNYQALNSDVLLTIAA